MGARRVWAGGVAAIALALVPAASATAHAPPDAQGGGPVAASADDAQTIALRQKYFGAANVDPATGAVRRDKVIMSWFGVTNFAMAIRGHVVLLDAWVPRGAHSGYVPSSPAELAALRPESIFIGHAHFDHAADAVPIAQASGATIIGSAEQCAALRSRADAMTAPHCVEALPANAPPGTRAEIPSAIRGVEATIVKHLHSAGKSPDGKDGYHVPVTPPPSTTQLEHPATPEDMAQLVEHAPDSEAGTVLYRFRVGDLSLLWNDSAGPLADDAPGVFDVFRALRPIDVQVGAIQGFNQITNGMRDPRMYIEAFAPKLLVPTHHDDWAAGITTKGENYRAPLDQELTRIPPERRPQVRFITDPADYVRPDVLTFDVKYAPLKITRRCVGSGRARIAIGGDTADLRAVRFRVSGSRKSRLDVRAPFTLTTRRTARVTAAAADFDGSRHILRRSVRACGG
jgi:hypothetical protein